MTVDLSGVNRIYDGATCPNCGTKNGGYRWQKDCKGRFHNYCGHIEETFENWESIVQRYVNDDYVIHIDGGSIHQKSLMSPKIQHKFVNFDGSKLGKDSCFVATVVFGDIDEPEVKTLRSWRDNYLSQKAFGRYLIKLYYKNGRYLSEFVKRHIYLGPVFKFVIIFMMRMLKIR